jgi:hypothetical protein
MRAKSSEQTLFAIISDGSPDASLNAKVFTMQAKENTGPGTEKQAPPGYCSTTTAENSTFEFLAKDGEAAVPFILMNISPDGVAVDERQDFAFSVRSKGKLRIVYRLQLPTSLFELRRDKAAQHIEASIKRNQ